MAHIIERLKLRERWPAIVLVGGGVCMAAALWLYSRDASSPPVRDGVVEQNLVVIPRPFSASIGFTGTIVAGDAIGIFAPFDGTVKAIGFTYGDRVVPGQMLVELNTSELQKSRNEAESAALKASQASAEMSGWDSGPEVSRAQRAAVTAEHTLDEIDHKILETNELLDKGLVPRAEYDGLLQQRRSQQMAVVAAREDLATTLARGRGVNRRVTELTLANARMRLAELDGQFRVAVVRAVAAGAIVRPPVGKMDTDSGGVRVGMLLSRGQAIGSIARAGSLGVTFRIDEGDVHQLKAGLPVTVTGPGFSGIVLTGKIFSVAGEADVASTTKPTFNAIIRLDPLTPEQEQKIRIGMTANIAITVYNNAAALVVPPQAVQGAAPAATVLIRDRTNDVPRVATVQIGRVAPDGVEILSGLKAGETVVWHVPAAPASPPAP